VTMPAKSHDPNAGEPHTGPEERRFRPVAAAAQVERLLEIIRAAIQRGASDILIRAGDGVQARIQGHLVPLDTPVLGVVDTREIVTHMLQTAPNAPTLEELRDYSGPWSAPGIARFRCSILRQRSSFMIVLRVIPDQLPTFDSLGIPPALGRAVLADHGLILVAGNPGSGRTSTIAALIHHLNTQSPTRRHIVALESSIGFLHRGNKCYVTQREIGVDTDSLADGMRSALEQDADVIVASTDLDDHETIDLAFRAVDQGRLVIAKIKGGDVVGTIKLLQDAYPTEARDAARLHVAESLRAVIAQRLLPRADGQGRVLAVELAFATPAVREVLADAARLGELRQVLADGRAQHGTQTFDQHLADLVISGKVAFEVAVVLASNALDFELQLRGLRR